MGKNKEGLITFEGPEGSGKSTQIKLLAEYLNKKKYDVLVTREPGGTILGSEIRDILLSTEHSILDYRTELLLFLADRAQHVAEVIRPALNSGKIVLCDRYIDSTFAYQVGGRGFGRDMVDQLNIFSSYDIAPSLTFLLDVDIHIGLKRATLRSADRFEQEKLEFHGRIRDAYLKLEKDQPFRIKRINSTYKNVDDVHSEIIGVMRKSGY